VLFLSVDTTARKDTDTCGSLLSAASSIREEEISAMHYRIKGQRVLINQAEFGEYMEKKVLELSSMAGDLIISLIIVSAVVLLNYMLVPYYFLFLLILVPLLARGFIHTKVESWMRRFFGELLEMS
jgi:hypothetical protein